MTVISTGYLTVEVIRATEILAERGVEAHHIGLATIDPLDEAVILELADCAGRVVTVEEHDERGGLGAGVAEILGGRMPVRRNTHHRCTSPPPLLRPLRRAAQAVQAGCLATRTAHRRPRGESG